MRVKCFIICIGFIFIQQIAQSQVKAINYQLKFNEQTNLFDCYLVIKEGHAKSLRERVQFNAQYTLVIPTGSSVDLAKSYMPLQNNQNYEGLQPLSWTLANTNISPKADPLNDYLSIVPTLSPASFYNDLKEGDEIKLFSLNIIPISDCGANVRVFENGLDPNSAARGMGGGDFSNGFTIGGVDQRYVSNEIQMPPSIDVVKNVEVKTVKNALSINVDMKPDLKFGPYTFEWKGPNNFKSYSEDLKFTSAKNVLNGWYNVEIMDSRGCIQTKSIEIDILNTSLPEIGLVMNPDLNESTELRDVIQSPEIRIFPNPANNYFNISIRANNGSKVNVDIMDAKGSTIIKKAYQSIIQNQSLDTNISLQDIVPGMYNIAVSIDEVVSTHKLIVVR